jgi:hypothetical protein
MKPTKPAVQISDADRKRKILITDKCTMTFKKLRGKGKSFRVDRYRCIEGRCLYHSMSVKTKVTKTKTAKQETYNLSDLNMIFMIFTAGLSNLATWSRSQ